MKKNTSSAGSRPYSVAYLCLVVLSIATPQVVYGQPTSDAIITSSPDGTFEFHIDPWISLHHFAFHYVREKEWQLKLRGRVSLLESDREMISDRFADECDALEQAYQPYLDSSLLFSTETRALAESLVDGQMSVVDPAVDGALADCMPAYLESLWSAHREAGERMVARLTDLLRENETEMSGLIASLSEGNWRDTPIRVDITPYANWAGAYTDDTPPHITMSSQDPEISGQFAFELLFHESGHLIPVSRPIEDAASAALQKYRVDSPRFAHYVLFYLSGLAAAHVLNDAQYVPYYRAQGLAEREAAAEFYTALEQTWDKGKTLGERMELAIEYVVDHR